MTTTVIVKAHCAKEKEVLITIDHGDKPESVVLQDGENWEGVVYDLKTISVRESVKK